MPDYDDLAFRRGFFLVLGAAIWLVLGAAVILVAPKGLRELGCLGVASAFAIQVGCGWVHMDAASHERPPI